MGEIHFKDIVQNNSNILSVRMKESAEKHDKNENRVNINGDELGV